MFGILMAGLGKLVFIFGKDVGSLLELELVHALGGVAVLCAAVDLQVLTFHWVPVVIYHQSLFPSLYLVIDCFLFYSSSFKILALLCLLLPSIV